MADAEAVLRSVERAAASGARSVTRSPPILQDAVEVVVSRWEVAVLREKPIADAHAWAFRVGANAARRLLGRRRTTELLGHEAVPDSAEQDEAPPESSWRQTLQLRLERGQIRLRGRQLDVLLKMMAPGMTYRRAAQELGMTHGNVRRSFRSGLARLRADRR